MQDVKIVNLNINNISEYGAGCIANPKHLGYKLKLEWLRERFSEGLVIKLLMDGKKQAGFIEYAPGEFAFRAVDAKGYMVIHCIWIYQKKYKGKGYGLLLLKECLEDAKKQKKKGVAVITSEGPWISGRKLFTRHGFEKVDQKDRFELLVKKFKKAENPKFRNNDVRKYKGLNLLYSDQCPMGVKFVEDIKDFSKKNNIKLKIVKLRYPEDAQNNPCAFGTFSIIYNGKIVADNPVSSTRFKNIVEKELKD
ncbi:MAG: hypothetical protein AMJ90_01050 [candidate division Zixibacteria bacterium SM23_73_2]|nr:MAG: hypothetical protein AMJ90_01050 [candidate division Zixibacteria bacterium SM23_73_2]